ncbi:MAG: IMP dehydrogenase [Spirochaetia bacterium]|nr:IMP dehydrogenase [Spirochaetia bacterium]
MKEIRKGLSFDDVLLVPAKSEIVPRDVNTQTRISRNITVQIPLVSAAMDTVTESRLAIALAREGGIGIIHKNLSIEEQAAEVDKVKRSQSGIITSPIALKPDDTVKDAMDLMARYHISGIPVTDDEGRLAGILTNRDLRFHTDYQMPLSEAMTRDNLITARPGTSLDEASTLLHTHRIEKLPIVDEHGILKGLITFKDIMKARDYPNSCKDQSGRLRVGAALSTGPGELERAAALVAAEVDLLVVDSAHGHNVMVAETVRMIKKAFPDVDVIAGNIVTGEAALALIEAGADAVKVGVGPGSICTTRVVAGVGVPQFTAVMDVAEVAAAHGIPVIADGGIKFSGDIVKAIAAGADIVMIGNLFAGTEESPGEVITHMGRNYKVHRGMGSVKAMQKGSKARYMQSEVNDAEKLVPEGIEGRVPFRGQLSAYVHQLIGGLRAGMGYCGCATIEQMKKNGSFIQVTQSGINESHPHDITITEEPLNYQISR